MSFTITEEKIREIRLASAKDIEIDGFTEKFKLVKMSAAAAFEYAEIEAKGDKLAGFRFMLGHAVAHQDGELLAAQEVELLMSVLSLDGLKKMLESSGVEVKGQTAAGKKRGSKRSATGTIA